MKRLNKDNSLIRDNNKSFSVGKPHPKKINTDRTINQTNFSRNADLIHNKYKSPNYKRNLKNLFNQSNNVQMNIQNQTSGDIILLQNQKGRGLVKSAKDYFSQTLKYEERLKVKKENEFVEKNEYLTVRQGNKKEITKAYRYQFRPHSDGVNPQPKKRLDSKIEKPKKNQNKKLEKSDEKTKNIIQSSSAKNTIRDTYNTHHGSIPIHSKFSKSNNFSTDFSLFNMPNSKQHSNPYKESKEENFFIKNKYRPLLENYLFI